ncbi:hypothetical protein ZOSMA_67G00470 [Zostera marina]|uniref:Uncharacterized protein n=1 Tax=Zostera marina TaxID=29655 RepID=A0A0K9NS01_ZOSMR|nr:hypothetical protein ZOSMA_67G00470 [Zostera marina]
MEFIHCTRIRKQQSILRKCREDLAVRKTSFTEFPIETLIGKGPNGGDPKISDVQFDASTSVNLCTPSPTLSFDSGEDNPMNELFNCIEMNEKLECQKSHVLDQENSIIDNPVILQGLELYEYMLVEPCQNLEIRSDVVCTDDASLVIPPPQKMDISPNLQTSELAIGDIEDTIEATKPLISSPHSMEKFEYDHVLKSSSNQSICPPSFELLDQSDMDVCDKIQPSFVAKSPLRLMNNSRPKYSTPYTYSKSNLILDRCRRGSVDIQAVG